MKLNLFIFLFIFFCGCSSKREVVEKYADGSPKKIIDRIDQKRYYEGVLYPHGGLKDEKFFKNGVQDSMQTDFSEEGKKIGEMTFRDGARNGVKITGTTEGTVIYGGDQIQDNSKTK